MVRQARIILRRPDGRPALPDTVAMHALDKISGAADKARGVRLTAEDCRALVLCITNMSGPNFEYDEHRWREAGYDSEASDALTAKWCAE